MRISNNQIFAAGIDSLQRHASDVMQAQRQISSGRRYSDASENALAAGLGVKVDFDNSQFEMFKVNQDYAWVSLSAAETQIESVRLAIDRFRTLMVQAGSDTIGEQGRKIIADEMRSIRETVRNFSAAKDANGEPILLQKDASELTKVFIAPSVDLYTAIRYEEVMGKLTPNSASAAGDYLDVDKELSGVIDVVSSNATPWLPTASQIDNMGKIAKQITSAQVKVGAIQNRLTAAEESSDLQNANLDEARNRLLETDLAEATTKLAQSNALLQAAQAIMSKMDLNSLFLKL